MAGFDAEAPLGLIDNLPDGDYQQAYTARRVVIGGNTPYAITASGLPAGMSLRVHDMTADLRVFVIPLQPPDTDGWSEERLARMVTRDMLIGVALARGIA